MTAAISANRGISANRKAKEAEVAAVKASWQKATSVVLLGFRTVDVPQVTELRARFRKAGVEYRVFKNSLIAQALKGTPLENNKDIEKALTGETGLAFSFEDPSAAAKVVRDFRKEDKEKNEKLEVKLGVLDASVVPGAKVETDLASMPGKDELRATLLATLQAPLQKLVQQLNAPVQNLVYLIEAKRKKDAGEG
jgi:large subunit ribosomal protein L10